MQVDFYIKPLLFISPSCFMKITQSEFSVHIQSTVFCHFKMSQFKWGSVEIPTGTWCCSEVELLSDTISENVDEKPTWL